MSDSHDPFKGNGETVDVVDDRLESTTEVKSEESGEPKYKDKEWLYHQYHILNKTMSQMAEEVEITTTGVQYWMEKYDIPRRSKAEGNSIVKGGDKLLWDSDWLHDQYIEQEKSTIEIAADRDVDPTTVIRALEREGIKRRDSEEAANNQYTGDRKYNDENWLRHQYVRLGKTAKQIAEENGWHEKSVYRALHEHNINTRSHRARFLLKRKKENAESQSSDRVLVSKEGIDASWRDLSDVERKDYVPYRDPKWLREKYCDEGLSGPEMAELCDVGTRTIYRWMDRHGIDRGE